MSTLYNILIVEDEIIASHYLKQLLRTLNYQHIFEVANANDALNIIETTHIDFAFLDININGPIDGISCARMMNEKHFTPIIYTTAYCDTITMQEAGKTNMFGYLMKPFEQQDVEAALHIALNRLATIQPDSKKEIEQKSIQLNSYQYFSISSQTFFSNSIPVDLTKKEISILSVLSVNVNQNISFNTLKENVWDNKEVSNSTVRDTIRRLRAKAPGLNIQSIAGFGYILKKS